MRIAKISIFALLGLFFAAGSVRADERYFTYSYEASTLPEDQFEFEQWVTQQNGRKDQDYAAWNFRTEIEYGLTEYLTSALYLNWDSTRTDDESEAKFKGVSSEWILRLLNSQIDPVGLALYGEYTSDGVDQELEGKILLSKNITDKITVAFNTIYEAEWEKEDGETEHEAKLQFTGGASYHFTPKWSAGIEIRNKSAYPDGFNLSGQEYNTWSVGPNVHFGNQKWWATLTVLPQVWGNGDGSSGNLQLEHEERFEARLIVGVFF